MKTSIGSIGGKGLVLFLTALISCSSTQRGPNGGAIVSLKNSDAKAEILANAESGAVLIYTWDLALKNNQPVNYKLLIIGSGNVTVDLHPYPAADDSAGYCSRFYGKADWLRGGQMRYGWLGGDVEQIRHEFKWDICLRAGKSRSTLFEKIDKNQKGMMGDGTELW